MHQKRRIETGSMEMTTAPINKLPSDVLCLILSKLPPQTVCVCREVLKSWNQLIQQPSFAKLHHSVSPLAITVVYNTLVDEKRLTGFGFVELSRGRNSRFRGYTLDVADKVIHNPRFDFSLVGSCNGLICLTRYIIRDHYKLVLCNPMLGTHIILPDLTYVERGSEFGLGYVPSLGQYKVVKIAYVSDQRRIVSYVCTVQCGTKRTVTPQAWRETSGLANGADGLIPQIYGWYSSPVFFRGSIIWMAKLHKDDKKLYGLICFDVEKELLQIITLRNPHVTEAVLDVRVYYDHEGIDHLYISERNIFSSNVWVMETDKCVEASCMRLKWVIQVPGIKRSLVKLFKVFEDGKLLISIEFSKLAHYDPNTGVLEKLDSLHFPGRYNELALDTPSLLGCML